MDLAENQTAEAFATAVERWARDGYLPTRAAAELFVGDSAGVDAMGVAAGASCARDTDWYQVVALYDRLVAVDPSPIVRLNRAIAIAAIGGPDRALSHIDRLTETLCGYHAFHVARAGLLQRAGRVDESRAAFNTAIGLTDNPAERNYLTRRRDQTPPLT